MKKTLMLCATSIMLAACATAGPRALAESSWTPVEIGGVAVPTLERPLELNFTAAGFRVDGFAGCNQFSGPYNIEGEAISFGPLISTKMACVAEEANAREAQFLGLLGSVSRYTRSGDTLRLFAGDREVIRLERRT